MIFFGNRKKNPMLPTEQNTKSMGISVGMVVSHECLTGLGSMGIMIVKTEPCTPRENSQVFIEWFKRHLRELARN